MIVIPSNRIEFHCVNDDSVLLPAILHPAYIYKEGDIFKVYDIFNEDTEEIIAKFEVVDIEHEVHCNFDGDQIILIHVKKLEGKDDK